MAPPQHHNSLKTSDWSQAHISPQNVQVLQNNSAMYPINHQLLSNSSITIGTDIQFNHVCSNSPYGYDAVPANLYYGGMHFADKNTLAPNNYMNPSSNYYPAYGSLSNDCHSNGLTLSHNVTQSSNYSCSFMNLPKLDTQTSTFNGIKPAASNGCNGLSTYNSNNWSTYNYKDRFVSNSCHVLPASSNNCSASNGHNGMSVSNGYNDWSPSTYPTNNSQHTSLMDSRTNTSFHHGYYNTQNPPFPSSTVTDPLLSNCYNKHSTQVNNTNSLYPSSNYPDYKVDQGLSVQSSQIFGHAYTLDRNPQSNNTFQSSKSSVQTFQIPEHFVSNNINQDSCGRYSSSKLSDCNILPSVYNYPANSSQSVNLAEVKKKSKRANKSISKEKRKPYLRRKPNEKSLVSFKSKPPSRKPEHPECGKHLTQIPFGLLLSSLYCCLFILSTVNIHNRN